MSSEVKLPRLGQGMEAGTIVKWLKSEGERVEKGEPLFEVDTDKATQEVEAEASGVLLKIAVSSGEVPVGQTIAVIGEEGESVAEPAAGPESQDRDDSSTESSTAATAEGDRLGGGRRDETATTRPQAADAANGGERVKASPLARRIARERGIRLEGLRGTGPEGRIIAEDVERGETRPEEAPAAAAAGTGRPQPGEGVEAVPLTKVRATIARRLTQAWEVPAFQLTVAANMTLANALVERARELNPGVRVTVTDLLTKVCAMALARHRDVNVQFTEEALLRYPSANVGIAVAAPQGLVVPVIPQAERRSLAEIAQARGDLVDRARENKLTQRDLEDGTFTISNLGMFGVDQFTAVLNPPQAAILAVGATTEQPVVRDGAVVARPMMTMTLTVDHRAVDGAEAADFLRTVKTFVEEPALAL